MEGDAPSEGFALSDSQNAVLGELCELSDAPEAKAALLHGVTGSGKTCVMMGIIDHVLKKGQSAILLLPEISLTPQTVRKFYSR